MFTGFNLRHVGLVASYAMRFSMRTGGGLLAIFLILLSGLSVAHMFIGGLEQAMARAPMDGHSEGEMVDHIERMAVPIVEWATGQSPEDAEYLVQEQPALLSGFWLILLFMLPFISVIAAFNQTAGDIGSRGLRYILLRTARPNVFTGRAFGTWFFSAFSVTLLVIVVVLYVGLKLRIYPAGQLMGGAFNGFLALMFILLPYILLCGWMSSMCDSPFAAFAACLLAVGGPIVVFALADSAMPQTDLGWLQRLHPWGWKFDLLSHDIGRRLGAFGVMLGFSALFYLLGVRHFGRRDM